MKTDRNVSREDLRAVESPPLSDALLSRMRPVAKTHPQTPSRVQVPQKEPGKKSTTIQLNAEVLDFFRSQGKGWQSKINDVLQDYVESVR